ncbi:polysaccharide deacetylase family protein [Dyella sp. 20L07]|uniref:polysaccharide deacetylase family protein n=1 Tax=Dyella sp. 20L07 TaxID=3384240 RepID=UPI003D269215
MNLRPRKQHLLRWLPDRVIQTLGSTTADARYLTFDDGPDPDHTPRLLDLLAAHGAHASFFLVGHKVEQHPALVERMVAEGHMIANHSYSHWSFKPMSLQKQLDEFHRTDALLHTFDGQPHHRWRTPQGYLDTRLLLYCASHNRTIVYWSYDSLDYQKPATDAFVVRLRHEPPRAGDIVLMHDDSALITDALAVLLPEWQAQGHRFIALPRTGP